jgi:acid stress-induced BolA-like protein IbaG/YrbA
LEHLRQHPTLLYSEYDFIRQGQIVLGLIIALIIVGWAVCGLLLLPPPEAVGKPLLEWLRQPGNLVRVGLLLAAFFIGVAVWLVPQRNPLSELRGEVTGIAVTVIIIDTLVDYRNRLERKREIFDQIKSPVRDVAVEALRLAVDYGWLEEIVQNIALGGVQWTGASLREANLQGVGLREANLREAILNEANLQGAKYTKETIWPKGFKPEQAGIILLD